MDNLMDFIELLHLMVKWNFLDVSSMDNLLEIVGKVWSEVKEIFEFSRQKLIFDFSFLFFPRKFKISFKFKNSFFEILQKKNLGKRRKF